MATLVTLPRLSDTMREGTISGWLKAIGENVDAGDPLADIETDKAVMTFESFDEGVLLHLFVEAGDAVPLGTPIAVLGKKDEDISALIAETAPLVAAALEGGGEAAPEPVPIQAAPAPVATAPIAAATVAETTPAPAPSGTNLDASVDADGVRVFATPLARRLAIERGIDLTTVVGSGPRGRIVQSDLDGMTRTRRIALGAGVNGVDAAPVEDEIIRASQMRRTIARRLVEAKTSAPHFYLTTTVDADALMAFRAEVNTSQDRLKVSYNDLVLRASVVALAAHPDVNVAWEGKTIRRFGGVHLGFAVAIEGGLISPVVRSAERLGLIDLGLKIRDLAGRAREGALQANEYQGNSFCVSNLGMFGVEHFTAIINPPAACILAVGALRPAPVVREGAVVAGHLMTLTLSCDHRAVDGAVGAAFLKDLKAALERPLSLVLQA